MMGEVQRIAVFDCQTAGVAGDMILAALIDLGVEEDRIFEVADMVKKSVDGCRGLTLRVKNVIRGGFRAKQVEIEVEDVKWRCGKDLVKMIEGLAKSLRLSPQAEKFAIETAHTLVGVEAALHAKTSSRVHLHETGSVDTVFEIIATAVALETLDLFKRTKFYSTPIAVGGGTFRFSHGRASSPSPAALEILRRGQIPIMGGPVEAELATPTGASMIVNLIDHVDKFYPPMKPLKVGYGAGSMKFSDTPNLLRLIIGNPLDAEYTSEEIVVLETNLDDVSGEVLGYTMERLFEAGAKDVYILPAFTKKGRPGHLVKIISDKMHVDPLVRVLFDETGTLGIRLQTSLRHILDREVIKVEVKLGGLKKPVRVKVSKDENGRIIKVKPEYEDAKSLGKRSGKPLREVYRLIEEEAWRSLGA